MRKVVLFDSAAVKPGQLVYFKKDEAQIYPMRFKFMAHGNAVIEKVIQQPGRPIDAIVDDRDLVMEVA